MADGASGAGRLVRTMWTAVAVGVALGASFAGATSAGAAPPAPWMNTSLSPVDRANLLLAQMTLDEKIAMVHGAGFDTTRFFGCVGYIAGNTRLGIPTLCLGDGPDGVGNGNTGVTQWPDSLSNASTWSTNLIRDYGAAYGSEQAGKGRNIALAPTINILRTPLWGRSFETFTEDPFLNGQLAAAEIHGIQSQHVIATAKHFVANNQEVLRNSINVVVSQRALHEIYYPGFEAAVQQGGVGAVMCSYNRVNGAYACENPDTLNTALKGELGFDGFVMSDWGATHSTVPAANNGLDMEMPGGAGGFFGPGYFGQPLKDAVLAGEVPISRLDDMVRRILTSMFRIGLFDHPTPDPATVRDAVVSSPAHLRFATQLSQSGTVLLKNAGGVLPLGSHVSSIAVIGDDARDHPQTQGGGSAAVIPSRPPITPLDAITARAGSGVRVSYAVGAIPTSPLPAIASSALAPSSGTGPGLLGTYYGTSDFSGTPVATQVDPSLDFDSAPVAGLPATWSAVWTGTITPPADGTYTFSLSTSGASHVWVNGQLVASNPGGFGASSRETPITLQGGLAVPIRVDFVSPGGFAAFTGTHLHVGWLNQDTLIASAVDAARSADVAVVFANDFSSEGSDRATLELPRWQDALISAVAAANPHTVVVLNTSGAVLMPWIDQVAGVVEAWYPGQQDGAAIAPLLFGDVNPSGHLTETFPATPTQGPAKTTLEYPGNGTDVFYDEGILVGYRWYQSSGEQPLFPFGYGLSYTTFSYSNVTATPQTTGGKRRVRVSFDVTNTGMRAGTDVAQVYLGLPASAGEPPKRLVGFQRVQLRAGETRHVSISLRPDQHPLSFWDEVAGGWTTPSGQYAVYVGDSSDAPLGASFTVAPRHS